MVSGSRIGLGFAGLTLGASLAAEFERQRERQMPDAILAAPDKRVFLIPFGPLADRQAAAERLEREERERRRKANFRHPQGPCGYRATGSKRNRRRQLAREREADRAFAETFADCLRGQLARTEAPR